MKQKTLFREGLEGIVAARTSLSHVDGQIGELLIAGFPLEELAPNATFEEVVYLLWHGSLPNRDALAAFRRDLAGRRELPEATLTLLRNAATHSVAPMDALRMAAGTLDLTGESEEQAQEVVARFPTIVAAYSRLRNGQEPIA